MYRYTLKHKSTFVYFRFLNNQSPRQQNSAEESLQQAPSNITLYTECKDEPLSAAQRSMQVKRFKEFKEQMLRLGDIAKEAKKLTAIPLALTDDAGSVNSDGDNETSTNKGFSPSKEANPTKSRNSSEEKLIGTDKIYDNPKYTTKIT